MQNVDANVVMSVKRRNSRDVTVERQNVETHM